MKTEQRQQMMKDWDKLHDKEQVKAVIGKEMTKDDFWESGAKQYNTRIYPAICSYIDNLHDKTVLEIGCGPGRLLRPLSEKFHSVIGVDVSRNAVNTAIENLTDCPNVIIKKTSGADLAGIESNSVDLVISFDVFQHMPTLAIQSENLAEISRVLKKSGIFAVQIKTTTGWMRWGGIPILPRAVRPLIPDNLVNLALRAAGYRSERLKKTWRGNLIRHSQVRVLFKRQGLDVKEIIPDGKGVRWIIVGQKS